MAETKECPACSFQETMAKREGASLPDFIAFAWIVGVATAPNAELDGLCSQHKADFLLTRAMIARKFIKDSAVEKPPTPTLEVLVTRLEYETIRGHVLASDDFEEVLRKVAAMFGPDVSRRFPGETIAFAVVDQAPTNPADRCRAVAAAGQGN